MTDKKMFDKKAIFQDFASWISSDDPETRISAIKALEDLIGDPEGMHLRINYLESLARAGSKESRISPISDPFSTADHINCVKKGLVKAYEKGDITADQIIRFASSVDGLRTFTDTLMDVPETLHATCWHNALVTNINPPQMEVTKMTAKDFSDSIGQSVTKMLSTWLEAISPKTPVPVMGFRGTATKETEQESPMDSMIEPKIVVQELSKLQDRSESISDKDIRKLWKKIPWSNLIKAAEEDRTWNSYLSQTGSDFISKFSESELTVLTDWIFASSSQDELLFLLILLKSTDLHKA
jgi:hypothetical protein